MDSIDIDFNLAEVLTDYQTDPSQLIEQRYASEVNLTRIRDVLNELTDRLTVSPEAINNEKVFDRTMYLL